MSIASAIFERSADTLAVTHDDSLVLLPGSVGVSGYVQDVAEMSQRGAKEYPQFQAGSDLISHIVHIRRNQLEEVTVDEVISISLGSSRYRVKHLVDDPNKPEIAFHCTL